MPAVEQANRLRRRPALPLHDPLGVEPDAFGAVPAPVREQGGGEAGVADRAHMGAAVAQARNGVRMGEQLGGGVEVAVEVVEDRPVQQRLAAVAEQEVEEQSSAGVARACGPGGDAVGRAGS